MNYIVRTNKDEVYFRQGDASIKLTSDQIRSLEYDRKERDFDSRGFLKEDQGEWYLTKAGRSLNFFLVIFLPSIAATTIEFLFFYS